MIEQWNELDGRTRAAILVVLGPIIAVSAAYLSPNPTETGGQVLRLYVLALAGYAGYHYAFND